MTFTQSSSGGQRGWRGALEGREVEVKCDERGVLYGRSKVVHGLSRYPAARRGGRRSSGLLAAGDGRQMGRRHATALVVAFDGPEPTINSQRCRPAVAADRRVCVCDVW
jgi:hypothetical protein